MKYLTNFNNSKLKYKTLQKKRIKILISDNGGEYTSKEVIAFCKEIGIKRELIVPYNPEQNGIAKRKNRSIEESVKSMLHDKDLPKLPCYMTLEEAFTGKKPSVDPLRIFYSPVYIHIPKNKRKKLDPTRMKGTFVGYSILQRHIGSI